MNKEPASYDKLAADFDRRWRRYVTRTLTFLRASISFDPSETILDIGCGTGEFERLILSEGQEQRMVGIDISDKMLRLAKNQCGAYRTAYFLSANACALPFPDHTFKLGASATASH